MLQTIDEIAQYEVDRLEPEDADYLRTIERDEIVMFHHTIGQDIRKEYSLWHIHPLTEKWRTDESSRDMRDGVDYSEDHPDSVSMKIMKRIWDIVNQK